MTLLGSEEFYGLKNGTGFQVTQKGLGSWEMRPV